MNGASCAEVLFSDGKDPAERVVFRTDGIPELAIKIIPKYEDMEEKLQDLLQMDEEYPSCVTVRSVFEPPGSDCWWIVMECCDCSVGDVICLLPTATEIELKAIAYSTLSALYMWHTDNDEAHGNVKPNNLFFKDGNLLLADAGMSEFSETQHPAQIYPEMEHYTVPLVSDIWALGISLIEIADKVPPFHNCSEEEILRRVQVETPQLVGEFDRSEHFEDFLSQCFTKEHTERPNAASLLEHEWLSGITEQECGQIINKMTQNLNQTLAAWTEVNGRLIHRSRVKMIFAEQIADTMRTSSSASIQSEIIEKALVPRQLPDKDDSVFYHPSQGIRDVNHDTLQDKTAGEFVVSLPNLAAEPTVTELINLSTCEVYVLGRNVDVLIQRVKNSNIVIGPCSGVVRIEQCEDVRISVAAKQVIIDSCERIVLPGLYTSMPLQVVDCKADDITVGPWNLSTRNQEEFAKFADLDPYNNHWNEVGNGDVDEENHIKVLPNPYSLFPNELKLSVGEEGKESQSCYKFRDLEPPVKCDDDNCLLVRFESQVNVIRRPSEVNAASIYLDNNSRCSFMFLDCLEDVKLRSLQSCLVILGPTDTLTIEECIGCVIVAMCEHVTVANSSQCCLLIWSQAGCTVSQSSFEFGHFNVAWPLLDKQLEEKGWDLEAETSRIVRDNRPTEPSEVFHLSQVGYQKIPVVDDDGELIAPIVFPFPDAIDSIVIHDTVCPPHQTVYPSKRSPVLQPEFSEFFNLYCGNKHAAITAIYQVSGLSSPTPSSPSSPTSPSFLSGSTSPKAFPEEFLEPIPNSSSTQVVLRGLRKRRVIIPTCDTSERFLFDRVCHSEIYHIKPLSNSKVHESGIIKNCRNSVIIAAPVKDVIQIEDCSNCIFILSSNQLVLKASVSCKLYLWCSNDVLLHRCLGINIYPWNIVYEGLNSQAVNAFGGHRLQQRSRHTKVFDLSRSDARIREPHFSMYSIRDVALETLWGDDVFPFVDKPEGKLHDAQQKSPQRILMNSTMESPEPPSPSVAEPARIISPNTISNVEDERIERVMDSLNGSEFSVESAIGCQVIVADVATTAEAVNCSDSTLVFISSSSVVLNNLSNCNVFVAAKEITASNLTNCKLHLFVSNNFFLSNCSNLTITPFNAKVPNLPTLFKNAHIDVGAKNLFDSPSSTNCTKVEIPDYIGLELQGFKLRKRLNDEPLCVPEIERFLLGVESTGHTSTEDNNNDDRPLFIRAVEDSKNGIPMKGPWDVSGSALPLVSKWDKAEVTTCGVSFFQGKTVILEDVPEKREQQVTFDTLKNCRVVVLGPCDSYMVDDCENCEFVLGPCKNSMFFRNCTNLCVTIACRQVRLRDVKDSEFFVHTETDPCVESSSGVILRPFNMRLPGSTAAFEEAKLTPMENRFRHAADFSRFSDPDVAIGFRVPDWVGVVKMRDIELTGRETPDAPKGVEEILNGTCEGGESLEKGGGTFLMGENGVNAEDALRQFKEREGIADDVSEEEEYAADPVPPSANEEIPVEIPVEEDIINNSNNNIANNNTVETIYSADGNFDAPNIPPKLKPLSERRVEASLPQYELPHSTVSTAKLESYCKKLPTLKCREELTNLYPSFKESLDKCTTVITVGKESIMAEVDGEHVMDVGDSNGVVLQGLIGATVVLSNSNGNRVSIIDSCLDCEFAIMQNEEVWLKDCSNCTVHCITNELLIASCYDCQLHTFVSSPPILENSTKIILQQWSLDVDTAYNKFSLSGAVNNFDRPFDLSKAGLGTSPTNIISNTSSKLEDMLNYQIIISEVQDTLPEELKKVYPRFKFCEPPPASGLPTPAIKQPVPEPEPEPESEPSPKSIPTDGRPLFIRAVEDSKNGIPMKGPWDVSGSALPLVSKWDKAEVTTCGVSFFQGKTVILEDVPEKREQQVTFDTLKNCRVVVLGPCDSYMVDDCENCEFVLGPCKNSMFFRNCTNLCVTIACRQVRLRDVKDSEFFVHTETDPCVESSSGVILRPFNMRLPGSTAAFEEAKLTPMENRFRHAADFSRFSDPNVAIGFRVPDWVGVVKMRDIELTGRETPDAPKGVEEILNGTCEGGESLEKGGGTFLMGENGVNAEDALRQFKEREGIADDVSEEEEYAADPVPPSANEEIPIESEEEFPMISLPAATSQQQPSEDEFQQVEEIGEATSSEQSSPKKTPTAAIQNLIKEVKFCDPGLLGLPDEAKKEYEQMIKTSKTSISKIKSNWVEIEKLEKDVDAMLSELGIS